MPSWRDSKKSWKTSKEARGHRRFGSRHQAEELLVFNQDTFVAIQEERLPEATSGIGMPGQRQTDLLMGSHRRQQARLASIQDAPEKSQRRDRRCLCRQSRCV